MGADLNRTGTSRDVVAPDRWLSPDRKFYRTAGRVSDEPMIPMMVRMPAAMADELRGISEREDRSISQTIRLAVRRYLETEAARER